MKPSIDDPTRRDVGLCIYQLEMAEEREKEALRQFYARQRKPYAFTGKELCKVLGWSLFWSGIIFALIWEAFGGFAH